MSLWPVECFFPLGYLYTAQWCVFNNYSLDKHRHQIWDHFLISVLKTEITNWPWILPQFTTKNWKMALVFFFDGFHFKIIILKILVLLRKKITFHTWKKIFQMHIVISKFQELYFCFSGPCWFQKFWRCTLDLCLFFSWIKINFAFQKALGDFFLVKPWPLQQPPEAKLLISVCLLKGQKYSF